MHFHSIVLMVCLSVGPALIVFDYIYNKHRLGAMRGSGIIAPEALGKYVCTNVLGAIPYIAHWCLILAIVIAYSESTWSALNLLLFAAMGVQMRALQEISHFSVHRSPVRHHGSVTCWLMSCSNAQCCSMI